MILTGLVFLALAAAVDPVRSQDIRIESNDVTLICTGHEDGDVVWKKDTETIAGQTGKEMNVKEDQGIVRGEYSCTHETVTHMFYLNVRVCPNCYELSGLMASAVIFGDLLVTAGVILIVYVCVPKNTARKQQNASRPRTSNAPPVPNPDYAPLNPHTRSDVYSGLK